MVYDLKQERRAAGPPMSAAAGSRANGSCSDPPEYVEGRLRGSQRQPAHNTGVFTLKPSCGIVPTRGHIPGPPGTLSTPDMAVLGPNARSASDRGRISAALQQASAH